MEETISKLMSAHYYLMDNPRFWYDKGLIDASRIFCVTASDLRKIAATHKTTHNAKNRPL